MRTNVVLNDELVREAMQYTHTTTKRALLDEALKTFVRVKAEERRQRNYRQHLQDLQGRLGDLKFRESAHDLVRGDRDR